MEYLILLMFWFVRCISIGDGPFRSISIVWCSIIDWLLGVILDIKLEMGHSSILFWEIGTIDTWPLLGIWCPLAPSIISISIFLLFLLYVPGFSRQVFMASQFFDVRLFVSGYILLICSFTSFSSTTSGSSSASELKEEIKAKVLKIAEVTSPMKRHGSLSWNNTPIC